jgi:carbonic anhydrase
MKIPLFLARCWLSALALTPHPRRLHHTRATKVEQAQSIGANFPLISKPAIAASFNHPIDIRSTINGRMPPLKLEFHTAAENLVNNGHTLQVNVDDEDDFMLEGETFRLKQYHFHTPSENQIDGHAYLLEAHFVHANAEGEIAVIAVMFEVGKENTALNPLIAAMSKQENQEVVVKQRMDLKPLFPEDRHYYRFSGSLTTPPCTEGLRWLVMKHPVMLSQSQLHDF